MVIAPVEKINKKNLRRLAWQRGFHGVAGVAQAIGRSRTTVHRAVRWPDQYAPTMEKLKEVLL
jgi:hypothetical protein